MANDKRFVVKNGLSGPNVRFANGSNTNAYMELSYAANGSLIIGGNSAFGALITISDGGQPVLTVNGDISFGTSGIVVNSTFYEATANNASFAFGKQESQLYVANAVFATTANNALRLNGKQESQLSVANAVFADTSNNAIYAYGKQESQLSVANAVFADTANNALRFNGKQESQLSVANAVFADTSNNAIYAYGKQESQLSVANAVFATTANNALRFNGKQESQLSVANAVFADTANNALRLNGKQESQLYVANAVYATLAGGVAGSFVANATFSDTANNALYLNGANSQFYTNATNITTGTLAEARLPFRMNQNVRTTDDVTFANGVFNGSVTIGGNLTLTGNLYSTNIQSLSVIDPIIKLAANNSGDVLWTGFISHYEGSGNTTNHTGLLRNPSSKEYLLISTYGDELSVNNNIILTNDTSLTYANLSINTLRLGNTSSVGTIDANTYTGTANNSTYSYGKQESQLSVANAVFATTANNALRFNGKQESQLSVANAVFADTANNALRFNGKQESQLSVANAVFADTANNALRFNGKQESQLSVANAVFADTANNALRFNGKQESQLSVANTANSAALQGATWQAPLGIGTVTANTGAFTTLTTSGITTFNANVVFNAGLVANSSTGASGQVLSSNGTSIYWTNANNISGTVANANNATYLNGKQEGQLSVANAVFATSANNALYAYGKQESQLSVNNAVYLAGRTWETAGAIGATVANTGAFTNATFAIANTTNYLSVRNIAHLSGDSNTTTAIAQVQIASFSANAYGSAKIYIQATETSTTRRHVTELLVVHDNSIASATEYGMLFTGATALATYEVDIVSNNVRVLATPASANTIAFRVSEQLFVI